MEKQKQITSTGKSSINRTLSSLCANVSVYKHRFIYFIQAIKQMKRYLQPNGDINQLKLRPAITSGYVCSEEE